MMPEMIWLTRRRGEYSKFDLWVERVLWTVFGCLSLVLVESTMCHVPGVMCHVSCAIFMLNEELQYELQPFLYRFFFIGVEITYCTNSKSMGLVIHTDDCMVEYQVAALMDTAEKKSGPQRNQL